MIDQKALLTPEELSKRLKLSAATIYKLLAQGELPYFKVGKCYRIPERAFETYMLREGNLARFVASSPAVPAAAERFVALIAAAPKEVRSRVLAIALFGSHARGEANEDSDIDLIVIVTDTTPELESEIAARSSQAMEEGDYDEFLSPLRMTLAHWERSRADGSPLAREICREGVLLWSNGSRRLKDIGIAPRRS